MLVEKEFFFKTQQTMEHISYEQSQGWHDFRIAAKKGNAIYFVDDKNDPKICIWGLIRTIPLMGKILQIEGKSYHTVPAKQAVKNFYEQIALDVKKKVFLIMVSDSDVYDVAYEIGIRQAGYIRPLAMRMCPLTILIDFTDPNWTVRRNWKLGSKEGKKKNLIFEYLPSPDFEQINAVCKMYSELAHNKGLGYGLKPDSLGSLLKDDKFKLFFVYTSDKQLILACIFYVYNKFSYEVIAANSSASRLINGSSPLMMTSILDWLKENGVEQCDFGRIGPGKRSANSVYEFKAHSGGPEVSYNGEWIYTHNKFLESIFYFLLNFKINRY